MGYVLGAGDFGIAPMVGGEIDRMAGSGFGGSVHSAQTAVWGAIDAGATGFWSLSRTFALALTIEASVPASRPSFVASEPSPGANRIIEQPFFVAARAFGGIECRFF